MDNNINRTIEIFEQLDMIPRESDNEKGISDFIKAWAEEKKLEVVQDEYYNLLIRKPASPGYESAEPLIIQSHMDMVCEKTPESTHNFDTDPIILKQEGDWIMSAVGTSIGADNAIGVATSMRILENDSLKHPELEIVFTVHEETDFMGAEVFDGKLLKGRRMINLDYEGDDSLVAGSCGGFGATMSIPVEREAAGDSVAYELKLSGLLGGHSGEDIHHGRGNALVLLSRLIRMSGCRLASIDGGSNRLAIPREAIAVVYAEPDFDVQCFFSEKFMNMKREFGSNGSEAGVEIKKLEASLNPLKQESSDRVINAILMYPNGPMEMCADFPGVVENSCNLGIAETAETVVKLVSEARSQHTTGFEFTMERKRILAEASGAELEIFTRYEPWEYKEDSKLRQTALQTYRNLYAEDMKELVLHAGLEVGNFVAKLDGLDVIAIGPNCEGLHSPSERVSVSSTEKHYEYLLALLEQLK